MYAPHTRTTAGLACIAIFCCGLGCAWATTVHTTSKAHASRPISVASYRILGGVGFGIDARARSRKGSGWFRKAPDAREVGERLTRLARRALGEAAVRVDRTGIDIALDRRVPVARLSVEDDATLRLVGETAPLGPGYHCELAARCAPLLEEVDYVWSEPVELGAVQRAMCAWLARELAAPAQVCFGVPPTRRFRIDAPLLSPLGPRDAAWCAGVRADPSRAADVFPWWTQSRGAHARSRAMTALWLEVPWREPLDDGERSVMKRVDDDLRAARDADPELPLPWRAWKELLAHLGIEDEDVEAHVAKAPPEAPIGYRRHDLDVELSGSWTVTLPGSMAGNWEDDGARYWATDGDRVVEFTSFTDDGSRTSEQLLAMAPEQHAVIARRHDGDVLGRAEAYDDGEVHVVVGLVASAPNVGILTCKGADDTWALATWRSLRSRS